ncbi:hypothetical protein Thimo_0447 [Thioflavicoccus mobilis 8321]|uniref:Anti-sigma-F factor NrsF n=1 Tax=Thioflavicoccus mobilis 8321 TaxID=765912 RepID=L0GTH5_9GAMM|nr:DUF1109 domain-containing protein [Thioflavicoccus mobilis]AGA89306.1 hypothetical protein Thimo_0447 [Thioflavicoccus mobilis 8321]
MKTDDLVQLLASDIEPVERHAVERRLAVALGLGAVLAATLMLTLLGVRPDLAQAMHLPLFWVKLGFVAALAWTSLLATLRLSRPGRRLGWVPGAMALPVLFIWALAGIILAGAEPPERPDLLLGATWQSCPWLIALLSLPVFAALLWALRGLAPTDLPAAGATTGLLAGTVGALVYCLHCPETAPPFVAIWYLLGMSLPGLLGGLAGSRLLRW